MPIVVDTLILLFLSASHRYPSVLLQGSLPSKLTSTPFSQHNQKYHLKIIVNEYRQSTMYI